MNDTVLPHEVEHCLELREVSLKCRELSARDVANVAFERAGLLGGPVGDAVEPATRVRLLWDALWEGGAAGAAAVLACADVARVELRFGDARSRSVARARTPLDPSGWLRAVSCALVTRDATALGVLGRTDLLIPFPSHLVDAFWSPLMTALVRIACGGSAASAIDEADRLLQPEHIMCGDPDVLLSELGLLPQLLRALDRADGFAIALEEAVRRYRDSPNEPPLLALEVAGLAALAHDRGVVFDDCGLPASLLKGPSAPPSCVLRWSPMKEEGARVRYSIGSQSEVRDETFDVSPNGAMFRRGDRLITSVSFVTKIADFGTFPPTVHAIAGYATDAAAFTPWGTIVLYARTEWTKSPAPARLFELVDSKSAPRLIPAELPWEIESLRAACDAVLLFPNKYVDRPDLRPLALRKDGLVTLDAPAPKRKKNSLHTVVLDCDACALDDRTAIVVWDREPYLWEGGPLVPLGQREVNVGYSDARDRSVSLGDVALFIAEGDLVQVDRAGCSSDAPIETAKTAALGPEAAVIICESRYPDQGSLVIWWRASGELTFVPLELLGGEWPHGAFHAPTSDLLIVHAWDEIRAIPWQQVRSLPRQRQ